MNLESRIEKLEASRPRPIDGRELMDRMINAGRRARTEAEANRIMNDMLKTMSDEELKALC